MPAPGFAPSNGRVFTFDGNTYKCVDVNVDETAPSLERVDMTTLDIEPGEDAVMVLSPIKPKRDPDKVSITYKPLTTTVPIERGAQGTLDFGDRNGTYRCVKSGKAFKGKEFIEGTAEFEEVIDDEVVEFGS
jgi:hypothetical protein